MTERGSFASLIWGAYIGGSVSPEGLTEYL